MSKALRVRLYRGDTWRRAWLLRQPSGAPVDLTGATARLHVRSDTGALMIQASTADGRISIVPDDGRITMSVPYAATALTPGSYRYDIEVTYADGARQTIEQSTLIVLEDMSRD